MEEEEKKEDNVSRMSGDMPESLRHRSPYGFDNESHLNSPREVSKNFTKLSISNSGESVQISSKCKVNKSKLFKVKRKPVNFKSRKKTTKYGVQNELSTVES